METYASRLRKAEKQIQKEMINELIVKIKPIVEAYGFKHIDTQWEDWGEGPNHDRVDFYFKEKKMKGMFPDELSIMVQGNGKIYVCFSDESEEEDYEKDLKGRLDFNQIDEFLKTVPIN